MALFRWRLRWQFSSKKRRKHGILQRRSSLTPARAVIPPPHGFDNIVITKEFLTTLSLEANVIWDKYGGNRGSAKSFWISTNEQPQCTTELFAKLIARHHTNDNYLGAELWVQLRKGDLSDPERSEKSSQSPAGLEFHFDKDETAADATDEWFHPKVSTATYLDHGDPHYPPGGAPLVIFNTSSEEVSSSAHLRSWVVFPVVNRHVAFSGSYLHGIPADIMPRLATFDTDKSSRQQSEAISHNYSRLSLLVNIWTDHKPVDIGRLPRLSTKSTVIDDALYTDNMCDVLSTQNPIAVDKVTVSKTANKSDDSLHWLQEHREGDTGPLPIIKLQQEYLAASRFNSKLVSTTSPKLQSKITATVYR